MTRSISLGKMTTRLLATRIWGYLPALVNSIILARVLGVEKLGVYAYAVGLSGFFGLVPNMGVSSVLMRTIANEGKEGLGVFKTAWRIQCFLALFVMGLIPAFAALLPERPAPIWYVFLAASQLGIGSLSWPYLAFLGGISRFDLIARVEFVSSLIGISTLSLSALIAGSVQGFLWAHVAAAALCALFSRITASPFILAENIKPVSIKTLLKQSFPFGVLGIFQSLYTRIDILLLGQLSTASVLGLYSAAYKPINRLVLLGGTVAGVLFPLMAQSIYKPVPVTFYRGLRALAAGGVAAALLLTGLGGVILKVLYGKSFSLAAPMLGLLAWSVAANWFYAPLAVALQAQKQERLWLCSMGIALFLNTAINFIAIPRWGGEGAAAATLISEFVLLILGVFLVKTKLNVSFSVKPIFAVVFSSFVAGGFLFLFWSLGALLATSISLFVYAGLLFLLGGVPKGDLSAFLKTIRNSQKESLDV